MIDCDNLVMLYTLLVRGPVQNIGATIKWL